MSYGTKYKVLFKTLSEIPCEIRLDVKDYNGAVIELTGGGDPIKIEVDTSDVLVPIRSSSATISVYGSDYLQDIYTSDPQGIKATLLVNNVVKWIGYVTPDTFSQDFSSPEFIYEIECVAALSTLKYKEFDLTADKVTFLDIIKRARDLSGYSELYLTSSIQTITGTNVYSSLGISSSNFYDELGDAMTYYEVLEEIATYIGCCINVYNNAIYFIDYLAVKKGLNTYHKYIGDTLTSVTLSDIKSVSDYRGTGAKLNRLAGKNKITVNCSLYEIDNLLPQFDDKGTVFVRAYEPVGFVSRYYIHPKHFFYTYTETEVIETHDPINSSLAGSSFTRVSEYDSENIPSKLSFSNELIVRTIIGTELSNAVKILENTDRVLRLASDRSIMVHPDVWFCIGFRFKRTKDLGYKVDLGFKHSNDTVINHKASLRIGDLYFNGTSWTTTVSTFNIPMTAKKDTLVLNSYLSVDNNNTYDKGLGDLSGYTFRAPTSIVTGEMEFILYSISPSLYPYSTTECSRAHHYQDIQLGYGIPSPESVYNDYSETKNDLIYESDEIADFIEEAQEIDLNICTNPSGRLALSSVFEGNAFLKELTINSIPFTGIPEEGLIERGLQIYSKPRLNITPTLENNSRPYSLLTEPHLNKQFIVAGYEEDIKMESCTYNLIEL